MKKFWLSCFAVAAVLSGGCVRTSTLDWSKPVPGAVSSTGKPVVWNLKARNCGVYLFNTIPIWSGKVTRPNRKDYELWRDMVNEWDMRRLLDRELKRLGAAQVEDIKMQYYSTGAWGLWIFWKKSIVATGVAVKKEANVKKSVIELTE